LRSLSAIQRVAVRGMFERALAMRAGRQDSFERRADFLGHAPAGHVINGDKQLQPSQAQVFEAETCDEPHGRGSDALACLAGSHPIADVRRAARAYLVQTDPTEEPCRVSAGDGEVVPRARVPRLNGLGDVSTRYRIR